MNDKSRFYIKTNTVTLQILWNFFTRTKQTAYGTVICSQWYGLNNIPDSALEWV